MQEYSISDLQAMMKSGEMTSRLITESYLKRIESLDRNGPRVNSVIEINPDAMAIAAERDEERRKGRLRGPLHGVPILVKDNIDTHDRMQTTSGSLALEGHVARKDAFLVRRLRNSGAVLLGKTNLSEWANFRGKRSISGWSSRGGLTRNPYALDRSAFGSSSGSGAAVAENFCAAAIGTETDGSIICPAQTNGIVGIKPTLGLVSRSGIIPIAHSQDTAGPMARTVADAAILLSVIAGWDPSDQATRHQRNRIGRNLLIDLDQKGLQGARIGIARNMAGTDPRVTKILDSAIDSMKECGAVILDPANLPNYDKFTKTELEVLLFEFKADLNKYLGESRARVKSLEAVILFNEANRDRVLQYFGQERMLSAQEKSGLLDKKYRMALAKNHLLTRRNGIDSVFRKYKLDAIVVPSGGPAWLIDMINGDSINWDMESSSPPAVAGYPHLTVPAGSISGLPIGLSFIGRAWQEAVLIRLAYAFEQATLARRPPEFHVSSELDKNPKTQNHL